MKYLASFVIAAFCSLVLFAPAAKAATEPELKERFKSRYAQVEQLKQQGKLGETAVGYVEAVKPEFVADVRAVADPENADRRELYALIAKQTQTTPEMVGARNGARNFEKAKPGQWLKHADGVWRQK